MSSISSKKFKNVLIHLLIRNDYTLYLSEYVDEQYTRLLEDRHYMLVEFLDFYLKEMKLRAETKFRLVISLIIYNIEFNFYMQTNSLLHRSYLRVQLNITPVAFQLHDDGVKILLTCIENNYTYKKNKKNKNSSITRLNLNGHNLRDLAAGYVAEFLERSLTNVIEIRLLENPLSEEGALTLLSGLYYKCFFFLVLIITSVF
jgi:hypothetical protein